MGEPHSLTDWQVSEASEDAELDDFCLPEIVKNRSVKQMWKLNSIKHNRRKQDTRWTGKDLASDVRRHGGGWFGVHICILRDKSRIMRGDAAQAMGATWWQMHQTERNMKKSLMLFPKLANNLRISKCNWEWFRHYIKNKSLFIGIYSSMKNNIYGTFSFYKSKEKFYF